MVMLAMVWCLAAADLLDNLNEGQLGVIQLTKGTASNYNGQGKISQHLDAVFDLYGLRETPRMFKKDLEPALVLSFESALSETASALAADQQQLLVGNDGRNGTSKFSSTPWHIRAFVLNGSGAARGCAPHLSSSGRAALRVGVRAILNVAVDRDGADSDGKKKSGDVTGRKHGTAVAVADATRKAAHSTKFASRLRELLQAKEPLKTSMLDIQPVQPDGAPVRKARKGGSDVLHPSASVADVSADTMADNDAPAHAGSSRHTLPSSPVIVLFGVLLYLVLLFCRRACRTVIEQLGLDALFRPNDDDIVSPYGYRRASSGAKRQNRRRRRREREREQRANEAAAAAEETEAAAAAATGATPTSVGHSPSADARRFSAGGDRRRSSAGGMRRRSSAGGSRRQSRMERGGEVQSSDSDLDLPSRNSPFTSDEDSGGSDREHASPHHTLTPRTLMRELHNKV
eukprot:g3029.t1